MSTRDSDVGHTALRFWEKVDFQGECWTWTAGLNTGGYGRFSIRSKGYPAHRWAYEFCVGQIPDGLHLDHLCRVRNCVNPDHLEPVTPRENYLRGISPFALNARKTECAEGHPLSGENVQIDERGNRRCKQCLADATRRWKRRHPDRKRPVRHRSPSGCTPENCLNPAHRKDGSRTQYPITLPDQNVNATHCPHGHEYQGHNLYIDPAGRRRCRSCRARYNRASKDAVDSQERTASA